MVGRVVGLKKATHSVVGDIFQKYTPNSLKNLSSHLYFTNLCGEETSGLSEHLRKKRKRIAASSILATVGGTIGYPFLKANELIMNVIENNGELYKVTPSEKLTWIEKGLYPLTKIRLGPFPLTTYLWVGTIIAGGVIGYVLMKKWEERDKNSEGV